MLARRLKTAIPLILLLFLVFYLPGSAGRFLFTALAASFFFLAIAEAIALSELAGKKTFILPLYLYATLLFVCSSLNTAHPANLFLQLSLETLGAILFMLGSFWLSFTLPSGRGSLRQLYAAFAIAFYICWPLSFVPKLFFLSSGNWLLGYMILTAKLADTGAYFAGTLSARLPGGNHKLAKVISPKKSWEGLLGGLLCSLLGSLLFYHYFHAHLHFDDLGSLLGTRISLSYADAWLLGLAAPLIGLLGDLAESAMKRAAQAKDSGSLPGLGGLLDTLDSLIPLAPLFYAWLILKNALLLLR